MAEHPNVAMVRSAYEAFAKGDLDGALQTWPMIAYSISVAMARTAVTTRAVRPSPRR